MTAAQFTSPAERHRVELTENLCTSVAQLTALCRLMYLSDFLALEDRLQLELISLADDLAIRADSYARQAADVIEGDAQ